MIRIEDYQDFQIGKLASTLLRRMLEDGMAAKTEIPFLENASYCKQFLGINYPLLVKDTENFEKVRYYKTPLIVYGQRYYMCSQWFETDTNNDRPYLEQWIKNI